MKVLVTGVAGDIGNSIGRVLKESTIVDNVFGCDIHNEHLGNQVFDACEVVPRANEKDYLEKLRCLKEGLGLDAIVPTSEPELRFLAARSADDYYGLPFVMANLQAMEIGFDKYRTSEFVRSLGCQSPWTKRVIDEMPSEYPCILKSRSGAGGQGVYLVKDAERVSAYRTLYPDYIWQEYMPDNHHEYTCGVYGCADETFRTIVFRRRLAAGVTGYAELVQNQDIENLCVRVAKGLSLKGSINIQLRLTSKGPMIFEINPRFSSTVAFRHKLGFQDVVWSLQEQVLGEVTNYSPHYTIGTRMYRIFDELIVS